ncbi:Uncharacterised protein [Klebsiella variicola]|uniref:hypothetical protein n=1 Tax=Klebsiella variicola TaxID=244366 RepID=UPI0007CA3C0B|nr:hypothetical protein [Klebsiella variicola]SAR71317.1 Uncharacterised protein [Klebsiella variicola]SAV79706.1 Uncharacterised protein [Klebsiella variicola]HCB1313322.1 hypothetical protein [Klebsiella variicola subsp. variicola]
MTITLQAVNELIASLESAGKLSIREQKFLKLAKAYHQLAAENVAMKRVPETDSVAMLLALNSFRSELLPDVGLQKAFESLMYHRMTPATDAYLAGIKADAITASLDACSDYLETDCVMDRLDISYEEAEKRTSGAIEFHDAIVAFVNRLREGAK